MNVSRGPAKPIDPEAGTRRAAALRQAVWEASRDMDAGQIRRYVEDVLQEIAEDDG